MRIEACIACAAILAASPAPAEKLIGVPNVVDGDTIDLFSVPPEPGDFVRVRLWGIDAPEAGQVAHGLGGGVVDASKRAKAALVGELQFSPFVVCEVINRDRWGRAVGLCFTRRLNHRSRSISAAMVRSGWALDFTRYSRGAFAREQSEAKRRRRGLWALRFQAPWEWRKAR